MMQSPSSISSRPSVRASRRLEAQDGSRRPPARALVALLDISFALTRSVQSMIRHLLTLTAIAFALASAPVLAANPQVELDTTAGKIRLELYPEAAPKTVENFLAYVKGKQYDGTQFHRVIDGFMIQGGGYGTDFREKPTRAPIANEAEKSSKAGILNTPGTVAMARTSEPNSATAQFFINVADN